MSSERRLHRRHARAHRRTLARDKCRDRVERQARGLGRGRGGGGGRRDTGPAHQTCRRRATALARRRTRAPASPSSPSSPAPSRPSPNTVGRRVLCEPLSLLPRQIAISRLLDQRGHIEDELDAPLVGMQPADLGGQRVCLRALRLRLHLRRFEPVARDRRHAPQHVDLRELDAEGLRALDHAARLRSTAGKVVGGLGGGVDPRGKQHGRRERRRDQRGALGGSAALGAAAAVDVGPRSLDGAENAALHLVLDRAQPRLETLHALVGLDGGGDGDFDRLELLQRPRDGGQLELLLAPLLAQVGGALGERRLRAGRGRHVHQRGRQGGGAAHAQGGGGAGYCCLTTQSLAHHQPTRRSAASDGRAALPPRLPMPPPRRGAPPHTPAAGPAPRAPTTGDRPDLELDLAPRRQPERPVHIIDLRYAHLLLQRPQLAPPLGQQHALAHRTPRRVDRGRDELKEALLELGPRLVGVVVVDDHVKRVHLRQAAVPAHDAVGDVRFGLCERVHLRLTLPLPQQRLHLERGLPTQVRLTLVRGRAEQHLDLAHVHRHAQPADDLLVRLLLLAAAATPPATPPPLGGLCAQLRRLG